jgi:thiol-disulfide isomerase/thioredoxin
MAINDPLFLLLQFKFALSGMFKYLLLIISLLLSNDLTAQTFTDPDAAFTYAANNNKPVLLVFEGSDWCIPCIKLDKNILSADAFIQFANENLTVLKADFPQKKKITPLLARQYDKLAEEFNKEGSFPKIVLLNPAQKMISVVGTLYENPEAMIHILQQELKRYHEKM